MLLFQLPAQYLEGFAHMLFHCFYRDAHFLCNRFVAQVIVVAEHKYLTAFLWQGINAAGNPGFQLISFQLNRLYHFLLVRLPDQHLVVVFFQQFIAQLVRHFVFNGIVEIPADVNISGQFISPEI